MCTSNWCFMTPINIIFTYWPSKAEDEWANKSFKLTEQTQSFDGAPWTLEKLLHFFWVFLSWNKLYTVKKKKQKKFKKKAKCKSTPRCFVAHWTYSANSNVRIRSSCEVQQLFSISVHMMELLNLQHEWWHLEVLKKTVKENGHHYSWLHPGSHTDNEIRCVN